MSETKDDRAKPKRTTRVSGASPTSRNTMEKSGTDRPEGKDIPSSRPVTKARRTVTLDVDVVTELESRGGSVSAQLNAWARRGMESDRRQAQILELVAEFEAEFGVIDEADVKRWEDLLS